MKQTKGSRVSYYRNGLRNGGLSYSEIERSKVIVNGMTGNGPLVYDSVTVYKTETTIV